MKKLSLKNRILQYIRNQNGWSNGGDIERLTLEHGYKASNGSRRCRELENAGLIERKIEMGSVWYRAKEATHTTLYKLSTGEVVGKDLTY